MAEERKLLSAVGAKNAHEPGSYFAGHGLYLYVTKNHTKSWIYRFMLRGRAREMGLGSYPLVSLRKARELAWQAKKQVSDAIDPIEARRAKRVETKREADRLKFRECMERFIKNHEVAWKNPRYAKNWRLMMEKDVYPVVGDLCADEMTTKDVLRVVEPIWETKTATAKIILNRMEFAFDALIARGERTAANPARWTHHLEHVLPRPSLVRPTQAQPSLPHDRLFDFMIALRQTDYIGSRALEFMILTALRPEEAVKARWEDISEKACLWTVPAEFMKGRRKGEKDHYVPLSKRALEILVEMKKFRNGQWVFPGRIPGEHLARESLRMTVVQMGWSGVTPHGFRATFDTWATHCQRYEIEVIEFALAHKVAVKAASQAGVDPNIRRTYQRDDLLDARRPLMEDWAKFTLTGKYPPKLHEPLAAE